MTGARPRIRLVAALAATLLLGAACANDDGSDAAAGTGSTGSTATGASGGSGTTASTGSSDGGGGGGRYDYGSGGGGGGGNDDGGSDDSGGGGAIALTADNFAFSPTALEVKSGAEISIENAAPGTPHTFTVDGTDIDLELSPGDVEDETIDLDPGTYAFHCRFHASMTGTLTVT